MLNPNILSSLQQYDTPTICNALELVDRSRLDFGYTHDHLFSYNATKGSVVGYAATATIRSFDTGGLDRKVIKERKLEYYKYVSDMPAPTVVVMQDLDGNQRGLGPFWGEFSTSIHKSFGCVGIVTDGSVRDLYTIPEDILILSAAGPRPSHAHVHIVDIGNQVNVCGMYVQSGAIVHADMHGAVTFAEDMAEAILEKAAICVEGERRILEACRDGSLDYAKLDELYRQK